MQHRILSVLFAAASMIGGYLLSNQAEIIGISALLVANIGFIFLVCKKKNMPQHEDLNETVRSLQHNGAQLRSSVNDILRLSAVLKETTQSSTQLAAGMLTANREVAQGAAQQDGDTEKCLQDISVLAQKLESMSGAITTTEDRIGMLNELSTVSSKNVQDTLTKSDATKTMFANLTKTVSRLKDSANNVNNIVNVMTEIANQTNLLSLNASIEAARAGEAGRGFAVVAGEVRKLSEQSFNSLKQIGDIISSINLEIESTIELIENTAQKFEAQLESVYEIDHAFSKIDQNVKETVEQQTIVKNTMSELLHFKNSMLETIENIAAVSSETAVTSEEATSINIRLNQSSEEILEIADKLESLIVKANTYVGCYQATTETKTKIKVALVTANPGDNQFNHSLVENAKKAAERYDFELVVRWPAKPVYEEQEALIQELERDGINALILIPASDKLASTIDRLYQHDIVTICIDSDVPDSKRVCYIGTDNYSAGQNMGKMIVKHLKGNGSVILSSHTDVWPNMKARLQGTKDYLANKPGIHIAATQIGFPNPDERAAELEKLLKQHPDASMIACVNMAFPPIVEKLKSRINLDNKIMLGFDNIPDNITSLKENTVTAILAQRQDLFGEVAIKRIHDYKEKHAVKEIEYLDTYEINQNNLKYVK